MKKTEEIYVVKGCTFCNTCLFDCPVGAISMSQNGAEIDQEKCCHCGECYENCASQAIKKIKSTEKNI